MYYPSKSVIQYYSKTIHQAEMLQQKAWPHFEPNLTYTMNIYKRKIQILEHNVSKYWRKFQEDSIQFDAL